MATIQNIGFRLDETIFKQTDWDRLDLFFFNDDAQTDPVDFSLSTFAGEILDKEAGAKIFDLSFNTPADDGRVAPSLSLADTTALTGRVVHYWVKVTTGGVVQGYFYGALEVSNAFIAGS